MWLGPLVRATPLPGYIYHEDGFTLKQQSDLTDLFQENGANLSLRGPEYLYTRQLIDRGKK